MERSKLVIALQEKLNDLTFYDYVESYHAEDLLKFIEENLEDKKQAKVEVKSDKKK